MAQIIPFNGVRYNREKISDISFVVTPPYDVISPKEQKKFYEKHENNCIRIILGEEHKDDTPQNNKYTRAKEFFNNWLKEKVLIQEDKPSIYLYSQEYKLKDEQITQTRFGFISLVKLEELTSGVVCPHEQTLSQPKRDRLELIRHCEANLSQIFGLYSDKKFHIEKDILKNYKSKPTIKIVDHEGTINTFWKISDTAVINKLIEMMKDKKIIIADGHHRYETALNYRNERKQNNPNHTGSELYNYVMFMLINTEDQGLTILPTHRLIHNLPDLEISKLLKQVSEFFEVIKISYLENNMMEKFKELSKNKHTFGIYTKDREFYVLVLKDDLIPEKFGDQTKSFSWRKLDVTILQHLIIERYLEVGHQHLKDGKNIVYSHDIEECVERVNSGEFQLVFFINSTQKEEVMEISGHGELMPQKSTYFYPKLLSGLVFNKLDPR